MLKDAMRRLFGLSVCLMLGGLLWQLVYVSRFSWRKTASLQVGIRQALEHLSVNFHEKGTQNLWASFLPVKFRSCVIPLNIERTCIDTIDSVISPPKCPLQELSEDCNLLKRVHGYDKIPDEEEISFPLAFGIKMHKSAEQAEQLLRTLYRPHNVYCIHIDKKTDDATFRKMMSVADCFQNVFLTDRVDLVYGGPQMVQTELVLMKCAMNCKIPWKYYLNLAGQEFPLRTNLEMVRILKMLNGSNDIASVPMPGHLRDRITYVHEINNGRIVKTDTRKKDPPFPIEIRKGTQYGSFSRAFVTSLLHDDVAKAIIDYLSDTYSSDETVWATLNGYPGVPGGYSVNVAHTPNNEHLSRAVAWELSDSYPCRGRYVHRVCVLSKGDLPWLLRQPNLVANKFGDDPESYQALACLETMLAQRVRLRVSTINRTYIRSLPYMKYPRDISKVSSRNSVVSQKN